MAYVPLWTDIIDEPCWKILDLPSEVYRFWTLCMLAAQKFDFVEGYLPDERTLAAWIHMERHAVRTQLGMAFNYRIIDLEDDGRYRVHDWNHWRCEKDAGASARKRRQRRRERASDPNSAPLSRDGHGDVTLKSRDGHGHDTQVVLDVTPQHSALQHSEDNTQKTAAHPACTRERDETTPEEKPGEEADDYPEYPNEATTPLFIMPGEHKLAEIEAREIWGLIWAAWKDPRLCREFYEHQQWVTVAGWKHAIRKIVRSGTTPGSIRYVEKAGVGYMVNGDPSSAPVKRGEIGKVAYRPTTAAKPQEVKGEVTYRPKIVPASPAPSRKLGPRIKAGDALKIMKGYGGAEHKTEAAS